MEINRETAIRLWNKTFGNETRVTDFSGRTIVKGAYDDRNSDYGWNVDHILPQSRGGKTADHNLVCCHILTNDEKADSFPSFKANGKRFQIVKVENHYEIRGVNQKSTSQKANHEETTNFLDSASGVRLFKKLEKEQNKKSFVGSILIRLQNVKSSAVIGFIEKLFNEENISFSKPWHSPYNETRVLVKNYNILTKEDVSQLLDKCIVLNTYIEYFFTKLDYVALYDIHYQINDFDSKQDMYTESQKVDFEKENSRLENALYINNLVYDNSEAKDRLPNLDFLRQEFQEYNFVYKKLASNLEKEVSE